MPAPLPSSPSSQFAPWEVATHVAAAARHGLFPVQQAASLTAFLTFASLLFLWPAYGLAALPIALIFGRLMALDLTTYTLPNVYTVPLIAIGLVHAFFHGFFMQALLVLILMMLLARTLTHARFKLGLGGGDLKLIAALFAFLPLTSAFWAIALGCVVWMPVTFAKPKAMVPFGVPLIVGWMILLRFPHLPNWLISTIS